MRLFKFLLNLAELVALLAILHVSVVISGLFYVIVLLIKGYTRLEVSNQYQDIMNMIEDKREGLKKESESMDDSYDALLSKMYVKGAEVLLIAPIKAAFELLAPGISEE